MVRQQPDALVGIERKGLKLIQMNSGRNAMVNPLLAVPLAQRVFFSGDDTPQRSPGVLYHVGIRAEGLNPW